MARPKPCRQRDMRGCPLVSLHLDLFILIAESNFHVQISHSIAIGGFRLCVFRSNVTGDWRAIESLRAVRWVGPSALMCLLGRVPGAMPQAGMVLRRWRVRHVKRVSPVLEGQRPGLIPAWGIAPGIL